MFDWLAMVVMVLFIRDIFPLSALPRLGLVVSDLKTGQLPFFDGQQFELWLCRGPSSDGVVVVFVEGGEGEEFARFVVCACTGGTQGCGGFFGITANT